MNGRAPVGPLVERRARYSPCLVRRPGPPAAAAPPSAPGRAMRKNGVPHERARRRQPDAALPRTSTSPRPSRRGAAPPDVAATPRLQDARGAVALPAFAGRCGAGRSRRPGRLAVRRCRARMLEGLTSVMDEALLMRRREAELQGNVAVRVEDGPPTPASATLAPGVGRPALHELHGDDTSPLPCSSTSWTCTTLGCRAWPCCLADEARLAWPRTRAPCGGA